MSILVSILTASLVFNFILVVDSKKQKNPSLSLHPKLFTQSQIEARNTNNVQVNVLTEQPDTLWWNQNTVGRMNPKSMTFG